MVDELARLRRQVRRLRALYASAHLINSSLAPEEIVRRVIHLIDRHFPQAYSAVLLLRPDGGELVVEDASEHFPSQVIGLRIPVSAGISGRAARTGRTVIVNDVRTDPDYIPGLPNCSSQVAVPIRYGERILGVLNLESPVPAAFHRDDVQLLESFANHLAVTLENARLFQAIREMAITDHSTGLHNYRHLQERLREEVSRALRHRRPLSVVMIDLDSFKQVNDRFGHAFGDFVLREFAGVLRRWVRAEDGVFRYGGDEFTLLLPDTTGEQAASLLGRLLDQTQSHRFANDRASILGIGFRAGIAVLPDDGSDAATLLHHADVALYRAKRSGGPCIACYREVVAAGD